MEVSVTSLIDPRFGTSIEVLMTLNEVKILEQIVAELKPAVAVEIGSWAGGSSLILAPHVGRLFCVDPWVDYYDQAGFDEAGVIPYQTPGFETFCANVKEYLLERVFPCRGESTLWSRIWTIPIDFLFIDGCHSYEAVKADIEGWLPHVRPGGVVLGHDYLKVSNGVEGFIWEFPGVAKAVDECFGDFQTIPGTSFWVHFKP